jgi:hypothetical protein
MKHATAARRETYEPRETIPVSGYRQSDKRVQRPEGSERARFGNAVMCTQHTKEIFHL